MFFISKIRVITTMIALYHIKWCIHFLAHLYFMSDAQACFILKFLPFGYKSDSHYFLMISFPLFQRFFFRILKFLHCWLLSKLAIFNFYLTKNLDSFIKIDFSFCRTFSFVQEVFSCENDRSKNNFLVKLELKETTFLQSRTQNPLTVPFLPFPLFLFPLVLISPICTFCCSWSSFVRTNLLILAV